MKNKQPVPDFIAQHMKNVLHESLVRNKEMGFNTIIRNFDAPHGNHISQTYIGEANYIGIPDIYKEGKHITGSFHTHPSIENAVTTPIGGEFSCTDIGTKIPLQHDIICAGSRRGITCAVVKETPDIHVINDINKCMILMEDYREDAKTIPNFKDSTKYKNYVRELDRLQRRIDKDIRDYVEFIHIK